MNPCLRERLAETINYLIKPTTHRKNNAAGPGVGIEDAEDSIYLLLEREWHSASQVDVVIHHFRFKIVITGFRNHCLS